MIMCGGKVCGKKYGVEDKFVWVCKTLYKEVEASVLLEESK